MAISIAEALPPGELWPERVYTLPETRYPARLNVARELLDVHAEGASGDRPALFFADQMLTYGELQRRVNRLANGLRALGLEPPDRVLLRMPNRPEFLISWLACLKLGVIPVATMPMLRARELGAILVDAGATTAIVWSELRDELARARIATPLLTRCIVVGGARSEEVAWESLIEGQSARCSAVDTRGDDVAMIAYTSGSTGVPKGCVHQHSDILASADSYARHVLCPSEEDRFGGHPSLAFTFGLGGLLVYPLRFGAATVLSGPFAAEAMLEAFQRHRVTVAFCAPTSYRLMLRVPEMERRYDLGSLRVCASGGEPVPAATYREWVERTGTEWLEGFGSTELFHSFLSSMAGKVRPGSTGFAVPGYESRVVDDEGNEVPRGTPGLIAIRGPTGCKYWRRPEQQARYVRFGGWNVTGDVFVQDADGYFVYQSRSDDMIVCGAYKIPGPEVERVLDEHPAVAESAVVAAPDAMRGAVPKAFVVLKPTISPSEALARELQQHVKGELAPYKYPRQVEFVPELPRTLTGKIRRAELRQREAARTERGGADHTPC